MTSQKEIDKLVEILGKQTSKYNEKQIKNAILAEGYDEDTATAVINKLFPKGKEDNNKGKAQEQKEIKQEQKQETKQDNKATIEKQEPKIAIIEKQDLSLDPDKQDYYKEVNYLLDQLKSLNSVKKPELSNPNMNIQNTTASQIITNKQETKTNSDLNSQIDSKKQELLKIKIESDDNIKIQTTDGKIINLNDYPRREWRNYRDKGKTLAEAKEEQMQKLRNDIYALKKQAGRGNEVQQEENISQKIKERVRQKSHGRIPEKRLEIESQNEAEKLREKYKDKEVERQDLDTAADNIYIQMTKNPNIYDDASEENKTDDKKEPENKKTITKQDTKKETQKNDNEFDLGLNLDSGNSDFNLSSDLNTQNDLGNEFDLGLNLNDDSDKNKKEKKK